MDLPSIEKSPELTDEECPDKLTMHFPDKSHSFAVLSVEAVRMDLPSGEKTAELTVNECPDKVTMHFPDKSHSFAVLSEEAVRMDLPSGEKNSGRTDSMWLTETA